MADGDIETELAEMRRELTATRVSLDNISASLREMRSLVGPFGLTLPDGSLLVQSLYGNKYLIDPLDLIISPNLVIYRQWEPDLSALVLGEVKPDTVFIDVGANFGYFTCLAGSRIGTTGRGKVWAFEPNPVCFSLLEKNILINWSMCPIKTSSAAVGAIAMEQQLAVPRNRAANGSLLGNQQSPVGSDCDVYAVQLRPLDDLLPEDEIVDLMKIDVEGHEWGVLSGARRVIGRSRNIRIVIEWAPDQMRSAGYSSDQLASLFEELELNAFTQQPNCSLREMSGAPLGRSDLGTLAYSNLVLAPKV